jgi:hypothetical protein
MRTIADGVKRYAKGDGFTIPMGGRVIVVTKGD